MKKEKSKEIPAELLALFGKPLTLEQALSKQQKSASEILEAIEATKHQGGAE